MTFTQRTTAPVYPNPYYVGTGYGGYNRCIVIDEDNGWTLPNCTGYAFGRFLEESTDTTCNLSTGNAKEWYGHSDGYERGTEPKLGAVICFSSPSYGHVGIVEEIASDGSWIICSESNYGEYGEYYWIRNKRYRSNNWNLTSSSTTVFQGFIYNPKIETETINLIPYKRRRVKHVIHLR